MITKQTRIVLMLTSALVSASVARAQTAPSDSWNMGSVTASATNSATVTLNGSITDTPTITAGTGNSISGAVVGATASQSIAVNVNGQSPDTAVVYGAIDLDASNTAAGAIALNGDLGTLGTAADGPTISAGTNNGISLAAVGASGSLSYSGLQVDSTSLETYTFTGTVAVDAVNDGAIDVGTSGGSGNPAGIYAGTITAGTGNSISVAGVGSSAAVSLASDVSGTSTAATVVSLQGPVGVTSTNTAAITVTSEIGSSGNSADGATISNGISNSISAAAVGASASASYSGVQTGTAGDETFAIAYDLGGDGAVGGSAAALDVRSTLTVTATNDAGGTVATTSAIYDAEITAGTANGVSVAAVGSSASFAATSLVSGATTAPTTTLVTGNITVSSTNSDTTASVDPSVTVSGSIFDSTIVGGISNTISAAAVGASASVAYSGVQTGGSAGDESFLLATDGSTAGLIDITSVNDGQTEVFSTIDTVNIDGGTSNGISVAAVGSSASFSADSIASGAGTAPTTLVQAGNIDLSSTNNGNVGVSGAIDSANIGAPATNSSVSSAAVGASGSVSVSQTTTVSAAADESFVLGAVDMGNSGNPGIVNTGGVTVSGAILDASISGGTSNSISQAAVGASGSISLTNIVDTAAPVGDVTIGASTMGVSNTGTISINSDIGSTNAAGDIATITGGANNSISVAAVGASGSVGFTTIGTDSSSAQTYNVGNTGISVANTGGVTVTATNYGASIGGGTGNSVSTAAVGASASNSFTIIVK